PRRRRRARRPGRVRQTVRHRRPALVAVRARPDCRRCGRRRRRDRPRGAGGDLRLGGHWLLLVAWWQTVSGTTPENLLNGENISFATMWSKWIGPGVLASGLAVATGMAG